jgi:hypothetical protein
MKQLQAIQANKIHSQYLKNIVRFHEVYEEFVNQIELMQGGGFTKLCAVSQNKCIQSYVKNKKSIAFFCPTKSFRLNFGALPRRLEEAGFAVLYFYGEIHDDSFENQEGSFFISDMEIEKKRLEFIDCFVTASIMDCLPKKPTKILMDHLSFSIFFPSFKEAQNLQGTYDEFIDTRGFKPAFGPLYDYQFISSKFVLEQVIFELNLNGYIDLESSNKDTLMSNFMLNRYKEIVYERLSTQRVAERITLVHTGYSKIDSYVKNSECKQPEDIIVYAPTPNDARNKKAWLPLMSINEHGADIVDQLCKNFPQYTIVFKPYVDENRDIVKYIVDANKHYPNFLFSDDENSMQLYSKAKIMVSDLSSTAFTFSLSTLRPTIFYSPNEDLIGAQIVDNGNYLQNRDKIGVVAKSLDLLVLEIEKALKDMGIISLQIKKLRDAYLFNTGESQKVIFKSIVAIMMHKELECEHTLLSKINF